MMRAHADRVVNFEALYGSGRRSVSRLDVGTHMAPHYVSRSGPAAFRSHPFACMDMNYDEDYMHPEPQARAPCARLWRGVSV